MGVPILSDGTPLTFEWLNAVANAINTLELNAEVNSNITVTQQTTGDEDIAIVTGKEPVSVKAAGRKRGWKVLKGIKFPKAFRDGDVTVVAMVTAGLGTKKPIPAGIAIGNVTATGFDAVIQMFDDEESLTEDGFEVRYIAIGKRTVV